MELKKEKSNPYLKYRVQRAIAIFSVLIFAGKLFAYYLTNSVGILTDALEGTVNVVTGFISLYSISISIKPKDLNHPFGHGKAEFLSASLEGFLIIIAGVIIIFEAIKRLISPSEINQLDIGIILVASAGVMNYLAGWYSIYIGKKNNSIALISGGKHLQSDTYSSIGLVMGLTILYFTKLQWLDSAIALCFGTIIIITGLKILKETTSNLMDEADFKLIEKISALLEKNRTNDWIDIHNLKLIKFGDTFHISCDLVLPWFINIADSHMEGEKLKNAILQSFSEDIVLVVHTDECRQNFCLNCKREDCSERKSDFVSSIRFTLESIVKERKEISIPGK